MTPNSQYLGGFGGQTVAFWRIDGIKELKLRADTNTDMHQFGQTGISRDCKSNYSLLIHQKENLC